MKLNINIVLKLQKLKKILVKRDTNQLMLDSMRYLQMYFAAIVLNDLMRKIPVKKLSKIFFILIKT